MKNFFNKILQGFGDLGDSIRYPLKWIYLGYIDVFLRYKRSILGPFWITISISLVILVLSTLWPQILSIDLKFFVPYFAIGYILWHWFSSTIIEASSSLSEFEGLIKQIKIPISAYLLRISLRNFLIFLHNSLLILLVLIIFKCDVDIYNFLLISIPSLLLLFITLTSIGILISIISVRYKDLTSIIGFIMQLLFFITPIIWHPDILIKASIVVKYNLFYYWVDLIRQPLLGLEVNEYSLPVTLISSIIFLLISAYVIGRYKKNIINWL